MEDGYEMEPGPIGRSNRRRASFVVGAVLVSLVVVIVKPWAVAPTGARVEPSPGLPIASAAVAAQAAVAAIAQAAPTWPAATIVTAEAAAATSETEGARAELTIHSGAWGVGSAGVGPRILREEPWSDWAAAVPETAADYPAHIPRWPGTGVCTGLPTIYDRPSLVAITTPADLAPDWRLDGWWTDGGHAATLEGSLRESSPAGDPGVRYLERTDNAKWPPGLYEFHVSSGRTTVALTVCLTRRG